MPTLPYRTTPPPPPDALPAFAALIFAAAFALPFAYVEEEAIEALMPSTQPTAFIAILIVPALLYAATAYPVRRAHRPSTLIALGNTTVNLLAAAAICAVSAYHAFGYSAQPAIFVFVPLLALYCLFLTTLLYLLISIRRLPKDRPPLP